MNKTLKLVLAGSILLVVPTVTSCSLDDDPENYPDYTTTVIGFQGLPNNLYGGPTSYGENLYGTSDQITTGYIANVDPLENIYAQFPINYAYNYDANFNMSWCYSFYNGGMALSDWHDMTDSTYNNQLSVYDTSSPSDGPFVVAFGASMKSNPKEATYEDYNECAKVYITDSKGYSVENIGEEETVYGIAKSANFQSVYINNTTYDFLTMRDGNAYAQALNDENKGWFKVQFITFNSTESSAKPTGYTEAYLANFDPSQADGYIGIIDEWIKVDLSMLPEASVLVINFVGSDTGEWGLNTPTYCALDNFEITKYYY